MLKWFTITLIAVVIFVSVLLGLGYLLKEHEISTTHLKQQLDQERAAKKVKNQIKQQKLNTIIETSRTEIVENTTELPRRTARLSKRKILIENLTCTSRKQCVLVDIEFTNLQCTFAINTIGASLFAKTTNDLSSVGKCPSYPKNSQLSCQSNLCTFGLINN